MNIDPAQTPDEAVEAAAQAAYNKWRAQIMAEEHDTMDEDMLDDVAPQWNDLGSNQQDWIDQARAAIAAALSQEKPNADS